MSVHIQIDGKVSCLRQAAAKYNPKSSKFASLDDLYTALKPIEMKFFDLLDNELDKVDKFYVDHEIEAKLRYVSISPLLSEWTYVYNNW